MKHSIRLGMQQKVGLVLILVFTAALIAFHTWNSGRTKHCVTEVSATVVRMEHKVTKDHDGHKTNVFRPVYSFSYGGKDYELSGSLYTNYENYHAGDETTLKINPDDPTEFYDPARSRKTAVIVSGMMLFFIGAGVVMIVMERRLN